MRIKIIKVGDIAKEKTFFVLPLSYESDGKTQDKKIYSFNTEAYKILKDAKPDQHYDVKLLKDKNGYWQWDKVELTTQASGTGGGNSRGFETPEERAHRQVLIVRQSCLAQAVAVKGAGEENADNITELAEKFESWVMRA